MLVSIKKIANRCCTYIQGPNTDPNIKRYNCILVGLVLFIMIYVTAMYVRLNHHEKAMKDQLPQILSNSIPFIHPVIVSNLVNGGTNKIAILKKTNVEMGDIVIVKYFGIIGVVTHVSQPGGGMIEIIYKDNRHQLHRIEIEREFIQAANPSQLHPWDLTN